MHRRAGWLIVGILAGLPILGGRGLGAEESKAPPPVVFGTTMDVRVVNVEAMARDRSGHPVQGLTAADFELTVDGRKAAIEYFTEISAGEEVASRTEAAPLPASAVKVGTSYLIFIDDAFSIDTQRNRVLSRLEQDLQLGPEDRVAIVAYNGRPFMLSNWTGDIGRVREALEKARQRPVRRLSPVWNPGVEGAAAAASVAMRGLPPPPGHKVFLLVSGGWPELIAHSEVAPWEVSPFITEVPLARLFEPVADTANLLGYTVYFLEIPGVFGFWNLGDTGWWTQTLPWGRFSIVGLGENLAPYQNLWQLARRTGGTVVLYSTRGGYLERVRQDASSYYSLAFSPEWKNDGRRHLIKVKARRPGVKVTTREGYFDMTPRMQTMLKVERTLFFGRRLEVEATAGKPRWAASAPSTCR